jgi:hypothetical protein
MSATRDIQAVLREQVIPAGGSRHGLVVGVERYRDSRLNLRCARADAQAIYDLMVDAECGLFPKDNVKLLLDEEATTENVWRCLANLRKAAGPEATVWIFYAGHAAPEGSSVYWVTHDADVDDLFSTALDRERIDSVLNEIPANRLLVMLDCCHAAATAAQRNPTRDLLTPQQLFAEYKGEGRITLASSDGKEKSVELGDQGHGAFTYFLQQGLRGEADMDGDGVVTANELWSYLRNKVSEASKLAGNKQTPVLLGQMQHDLALTLNPMATRRKERLEEAIRQRIGWDEKRELSTSEGRYCIDLLRRGPKTDGELELYDELDNLVEGKARIPTIKVLLKFAAESSGEFTKLNLPRPAPPPKVQPKPTIHHATQAIPPAADPFIRRLCPACGKTLKVTTVAIGQRIPCPGCATALRVNDQRELLIAPDDGAAVFRLCPVCKGTLRLDPHSAGQEAPCPGCQTLLKISAAREVSLVRSAAMPSEMGASPAGGMPNAIPWPPPLASFAMARRGAEVVGALMGTALVLYGGLAALLPGTITLFAAWGLTRRMRVAYKPLAPAIGVQLGYAGWLVFAMIVSGQYAEVLIDVIVLAIGLAWLAFRPSLMSLTVLIGYQLFGLVVNIVAINKVSWGDDLHKGLLVAIVLRIVSIGLMLYGFVKMQRTVPSTGGGASPMPVPQLPFDKRWLPWIGLAAAIVIVAVATIWSLGSAAPTDPKAAIAYQLKLLKAGDVNKLRECFADWLRPRVTAENVANASKEAANLTIDDLVASVEIQEPMTGFKTATIKMKNGRTLTTLLQTNGNGKWLADTLWFQ